MKKVSRQFQTLNRSTTKKKYRKPNNYAKIKHETHSDKDTVYNMFFDRLKGYV